MRPSSWSRPRRISPDVISAVACLVRASDHSTTSRDEGVEALQRLLDVYPWNATIYQDLGIALDQNGDPDTALGFMVRALALDAREFIPWQSLGVILQHLDALDESAIAEAIGMETKERNLKYRLA